MKERIFRYVLHCDIEAYEATGWVRLPALDGIHHGDHAALMEYKPKTDSSINGAAAASQPYL